MTLANASSLEVDDLIASAGTEVSGTAKSRVISVSGNVVTHQPIANTKGAYVNFTSSDTVFRGSSSISDVSSVDSAFPEVERFSGNLLYVENRGAVTRAADQIEDIKLIIEM
jgi:hypothetical protein